MAVLINSGDLDPSLPFRIQPKDKWRKLLDLKMSLLAQSLPRDCRMLVQFVDEASEVYAELGYESVEQMVTDGYQLSWSTVDLAVEWLRGNVPDAEIGIEDVSKRVRINQLKGTMSQSAIAAEVGCSRQYVHEVLSSESLQCQDSLDIPSHITRDADRADFRKLSPELQEKVRNREESMNAAAIEAGFRKRQISVPVGDAVTVVRRLVKNGYTLQDILDAWAAMEQSATE